MSTKHIDPDPVTAANSQSRARFYETLVKPALAKYSLPEEHTAENFEYHFDFSGTLSEAHFAACFDLIQETSSAAYAASSRGWKPAEKQAEMREPDMRYLLVLAKPEKASAASARLVAFTSLMITEEDDMPVVYCYEVHVSPAWQGKRIGAVLMQVLEAIGRQAQMQKAMLTVFTSNEAGIRFYERIGYTKYDEEQHPRARLRARLTGRGDWKPSYIIMARDL